MKVDQQAIDAYRQAAEIAGKRGMKIAHNGGMAFQIESDGKRVFHFSYAPADQPKRDRAAPKPHSRGVQGHLW